MLALYSCSWQGSLIGAYLLLLHELCVGAIIDNIAAKDGSGQDSIDFFSVNIFELAVKNKVVSGRSNGDSSSLSEQDKCKDIAVLNVFVSK